MTAVNGSDESPQSAEVSASMVFQVHINFTSSAGDPVTGYVADTGLAYGSRNGLSYGWSRDDSANGLDRHPGSAGTAPDELHDSFHAMHGVGANNVSWRIALPNGNYSVHLVAGDRADTSSVYRINLSTGSNGVVAAINGRATLANPWLERTVKVTVTNGLLYVINGAGTQSNKLNVIDITPVLPR